MVRKKVLVYPCGTEIGLEIYRAVHNSIHFELVGGSSSYDHGRFVYENHIDDLPFITDDSGLTEIEKFNRIIAEYKIDLIYPAMDGVLYKFAQYADSFDATVVCPPNEVANITRSKLRTYETLKDVIRTPRIYNSLDEVDKFPVFVKPDVGQGSVGAKKINTRNELISYVESFDKKMVISEYLGGTEYTVDCFTNIKGELVYAGGRQRNRMKNGISVNCIEKKDDRFVGIAKKINSKIKNVGGWFFQVKEDDNNELVLLEVSSRVAGTSAFCRCMGINLPLLTLFSFNGSDIDFVYKNNYKYYELDRALYNGYKLNIDYDTVYVDFDDTIYINNKLNIQLMAFLFQCLNRNIKLVLITKHRHNISEKLKELRILELFDEVIHIKDDEEKHIYLKNKNAIFIDDSYGERMKIREVHNLNIFDTHMIECLIDGGTL